LTNFEVRTLDHLANTYYAVAAIVHLGLHGVKNKLKLPAPVTCDPADLNDVERREMKVYPLPESVQESADFLLGEDGKPL